MSLEFLSALEQTRHRGCKASRRQTLFAVLNCVYLLRKLSAEIKIALRNMVNKILLVSSEDQREESKRGKEEGGEEN